MKELISVILPIYNVEKYLSRSIESVINQTYKEIEIILVNDGSTDSCGVICESYKNKDNRIKVISKKNGGLSDARNIGLKNSNGKYVCFIDSDDFIDERYIEKLYKLIKDNNAQIAVCNFIRVDEQEKTIEKNKQDSVNEEILSSKEILERINNNKYYPASVVAWNKLYDRSLFADILYPVGKLHEDEFTTYKLYYITEKIAITSECLYYYRSAQSSITKIFTEKRLDMIEALEGRLEFFKEKKEQKLYEISLIQYESMLLIYYIKCKLYLKDKEEIQDELLSKFKENYIEVIKSKECPILHKIKFMIGNKFPMLYYNIRRLMKNYDLF